MVAGPSNSKIVTPNGYNSPSTSVKEAKIKLAEYYCFPRPLPCRITQVCEGLNLLVPKWAHRMREVCRHLRRATANSIHRHKMRVIRRYFRRSSPNPHPIHRMRQWLRPYDVMMSSDLGSLTS